MFFKYRKYCGGVSILSNPLKYRYFCHHYTEHSSAVKRIDKDRFISISSTLSIIDKNFNLSIIIVFLKKAVLSEKMAKLQFLGLKSLLKGRGRRATKMNITFFIGNEIVNIFSFNNFSEKSNIFGENGEKIFGGHDHFLEGVILC